MTKSFMSGAFQLSINSWSAWFPEIESFDDLQSWSRGERTVELEGAPKVAFLPALMRRRLSHPSRIALELAYRACPAELRSTVRSVFASRYGELKTSVELLETIASNEPFSPTAFSHSVHNTAAGYFAIAAENRNPSTALAAGRETLSYSLLEAALLLERNPSEPVLVVYVTAPLDLCYRQFADEQLLGGGLALLVSNKGTLPLSVNFEKLLPELTRDASREQHLTLFVRWLLSAEPEIVLEGDRHRWALSSPMGREARVSAYSGVVV